jgi:hypothetical protein
MIDTYPHQNALFRIAVRLYIRSLMEYQTFGTDELAGLKEVLEFAVSPCWSRDVEELANGQGMKVLGVCIEKKYVSKLETGYVTTALGLEVIEHCKFGTGTTPTFSELQSDVIRSTIP